MAEERTVWFSDEFTPRRDWTWSGNFYFAAAIRSYCWFRCACQSSRTRENITTAVYPSGFFHILATIGVGERPDGSMNIGAPASQTSVLQVLPPQTGPNPPAGSCGNDGRQFCTMSRPTGLLGPIPQTPPNATEVIATPPWTHKLTQCGSFCTRPQDCGGGSGIAEGVQCRCALPSPKDSRTLGLDPVAPALVCLALAAVSGLAGRNVGASLDETGSEYQCACNDTSVSGRCCGNPDG